jgi:L-fucose isomerase-like protein
MRHAIKTTPVLGVIYGNRDFFPDQLITEARADIAKLFGQFGIKAIQLTPRPANAPSFSAGTPTKSTASSSACRISAMKKAWRTR